MVQQGVDRHRGHQQPQVDAQPQVGPAVVGEAQQIGPDHGGGADQPVQQDQGHVEYLLV